MPTLLEIGDDLRAVLSRIEDNGGEVDAELDAWFERLQEDLQGKADGYAALVTEFTSRAAVRKSEADRLAKLAATDEATARRLKARLLAFMEDHGIPRIDTARYRITVAANGGAQSVRVDVSPELLPKEYQRVSLSVDVEGLRKALAEGREIEGVALVPRGRHLRIG